VKLEEPGEGRRWGLFSGGTKKLFFKWPDSGRSSRREEATVRRSLRFPPVVVTVFCLVFFKASSSLMALGLPMLPRKNHPPGPWKESHSRPVHKVIRST